MNGGNESRIDRLTRVRKARLDNGDCTICPPHRGENDRGKDGKYIWPTGKFRPSKGKDRK